LRVEPLPIGKICTAVQVGYVALVLLFLALRVGAPRTVEAAAFVAATFTIASWLAYAVLWLKALAVRYRRAI
jgi:phosphatidylglycerophosphate synthase